VLLHGHAPAVLLLHVLAALEVRAECHLPLLRNGVAACHLVVVRAAAHLLLVLVTTHASGVGGGVKGSERLCFFGWYLRKPGIYGVLVVFSPPGSNDKPILEFLKKKEMGIFEVQRW